MKNHHYARRRREPSLFTPTIKAITAAVSQMCLSREKNTEERSALVAAIAQARINLALYDLGVSTTLIFEEIDPTETVFEQLRADGYAVAVPHPAWTRYN